MALLLDVLIVGQQSGSAHDHVADARLAAGVGVTVIQGEAQSQLAGEVHFTVEENALIGDEDIIEHGHAFDITCGGDRRVQIGVALQRECFSTDQINAFGIGRDRKRNGVIFFIRPHYAGGQNDQFIGIGRHSVMYFAAPYNDTILTALNNMQILVGVPLFRGACRAITLGIRLRTGTDQIVLLEVFQELQETLIVGCAVLGINVFDDGGQRIHHINAHTALYAAAAHAADLTGHLLLLQQILGTLVDVGKAVDGFAGDVRCCGHQILHLGIIYHAECHADRAAGSHDAGVVTADTLSVQVDVVTHPFQLFQILFLCSHKFLLRYYPE